MISLNLSTSILYQAKNPEQAPQLRLPNPANLHRS
jgi:hypothetical protein